MFLFYLAMAKDSNEMTTTESLELPPMEEGFVHFYWTDIYEDQQHAPGRLYLFGKVIYFFSLKLKTIFFSKPKLIFID